MAEVVFKAEPKYTELLIGCGTDRRKLLKVDDRAEWSNLITLDMDESVNPDVVHDLSSLPYPFLNEEFNEIHAYEVLEHVGAQGDWRFFFAQFDEFYRILKPGGLFYATVPKWDSVGAWGDPGHTRVINEMSVAFLDRSNYGKPPMTDYRGSYKGDFKAIASEYKDDRYLFCLRKR